MWMSRATFLKLLCDLGQRVQNAHIDKDERSGESGRGEGEGVAFAPSGTEGEARQTILYIDVPEFGDVEVHVEVWDRERLVVSVIDFQEGCVLASMEL